MGNETLSLDPPQNTSDRSGRNFLRATYVSRGAIHNPYIQEILTEYIVSTI